MISPELTDLSRRIGASLRQRGETVAVAEGSAGGLISATLLATPGASAYYLGGTVIYTAAAGRAWMETFARYLAQSVRLKVAATWGLGEAGAAGPANPYGDPAGHSWLAVDGPRTATRNVLTGGDVRAGNMVAFTAATLELFAEVLDAG
jgi:nicotinamide-nucleotide amidase